MGQDIGIVASGFFQGISEDGKALDVKFAGREDTLIVSDGGKGYYRLSEPSRIDKDGAEGIAEYVPNDVALCLFFWLTDCLWRSHLNPSRCFGGKHNHFFGGIVQTNSSKSLMLWQPVALGIGYLHC